ncbi:hypothetical protein [Gynuella sunshinyii]|uniref:Adenylate kinase and related kinase n=1 Tax=Gynuella sunshinyii YC6258 TaxID=1445510 RepID=A0A0C5VLT5_9GAMM|nr:hypothetical protein [Gynuella sunshinyii]AJQ95682.1 adenylate kinase and related kinase [Gynuella sunshinyii YC6258]
MNRIAILGNGGAGKSTLALLIGRATGIPVFHLDQIIWEENWKAISESEFQRKHEQIVAMPSWVIEGLGYNSTLWSRMRSADQIIFIDLPIFQHLFWAAKRSFKSLWTAPNGWSSGNSLMRKLPYIFRIIWHVHKNTRPYILKLLSDCLPEKVVHIKSKRELIEFRGKLNILNKAC